MDVKKLLREIETALNGTRATPEVRKVAAQFFKPLKGENLQSILSICEELLEKKTWQEKVIAFDWAFRMRKHYSRDTWQVFERWLLEYVKDWCDCDDFCTHAFGELLARYNEFFDKVIAWTEHPDFWVRRAAAVVHIYPIRTERAAGLDPFLIADRLMQDEHYLVLKGYGWLLKEFSRRNEDAVFNYLIKNRERMPRLAFRYALEKMPRERKQILMGT